MSTLKKLGVVSSGMLSTQRTCLIVAGMHRSGTSALARAINLLGFSTPKHLLGAEAHNETGHWEPERIVAVHDELLMRCGSQWDDWRALNIVDLPVSERREYRDRLRLLLMEEFENSERFVLKDPRICRFLPFYQKLLKSSRIADIYALPFRNPLEVCDSLQRRDKIGRAYASLVWLRHVVDSEFYTRAKPRGFCSYDDFLTNNALTLEKLSQDIGLDWPVPLPDVSELLEQHVRTDLQHHTADLEDLNASEDVNEWVRTAYSALLDLKDDPNHASAITRLDAVRKSLDEASSMVGAATFSEFARRRDEALKGQSRLQGFITQLEGVLEKSNTDILELEEKLLSTSQQAAEQAAKDSAAIAALANELTQAKLEKNQLEGIVERSDAQIQELEGKVLSTSQQAAEQAAKDSAAIAALSNELTQANLAKEQLRSELNQVTHALRAADDLGKRLAKSLEDAHEICAQRTKELVDAHSYTEELKQKLEYTLQSATAWERRFVEQHQAHTRDLEELTSSTSWQITRPLRGVKRLVTERGFARALLHSSARTVFFTVPMRKDMRQRLLKMYHDNRLRNSVLVAPAYSQPALPSQEFSRAATEGADTIHENSYPPGPQKSLLELPSDGRWNIAEYKARQDEIAAYLAALSRPDDNGAACANDMYPPQKTNGALVSIIVRTYSGRWPLLQTALQSVAAQTYRPLEVLVVEDGKETLRSNVEKLAAREGVTLRYLCSLKGGRSEAANIGLDEATGAYIGFLDDDDYLFPDHCARLVGVLSSRREIGAAYAAAIELSADLDRETMSFRNVSENAIFMTGIANSSELLHRNGFPIQAVLFRSSVCAPNDRFNPNLDALEDWLFWLRMLVGEQIAGIADITSAFYVPSSQTEHRKRISSHLAAEPFFAIQRNAFYEERRLTDMDPINARIRIQRQKALERAALPPLEDSQIPAEVPNTALYKALGGDVVPNLAPKYGPKIVAYTSINLRYLPKALAWARSVKKLNPDWETHILLNDAVPDNADSWPDVDVVYPISGLNVPNFHRWAFKMRVVELCTATKPFYAKLLLKAGFEYVFYFDPDTHAYSDLNALVDEFGDDEVLITPHCCEDAFADAELHYSEMSSLAHGVYNLGFLGLKQSETGHKVADFWCRRLLRHCADDHGRGLFTDQKWFNLVPVFFDRVKTLKHKGCNTASWNIVNRPILRENGNWTAGGQPLIFFHFSGYDRNVPRAMFDVFGRFNSDLETLITDYDETNERFAKKFPVWKSEWAFARYNNGKLIKDAHREIYRSGYQYELVYPQPFFAQGDSYFAHLEKLGEATIGKMVAPEGFIRRYF